MIKLALPLLLCAALPAQSLNVDPGTAQLVGVTTWQGEPAALLSCPRGYCSFDFYDPYQASFLDTLVTIEALLFYNPDPARVGDILYGADNLAPGAWYYSNNSQPNRVQFGWNYFEGGMPMSWGSAQGRGLYTHNYQLVFGDQNDPYWSLGNRMHFPGQVLLVATLRFR